MDMSIQLKSSDRRDLHAVAVVQQRRPAGHVLPLHLRQRARTSRATTISSTARTTKIDVSKVDVSMNGIELQDREFVAAIREGREPNASVAQVLPCYRTLDELERQLARRCPPEAPRRTPMIIDCHGHYTTAPAGARGLAQAADRRARRPVARSPSRASLAISDDEIRASLENAQLKMQRERGTDLTIFSPRASVDGAPHRRRERRAANGREICNDLDPPRVHALSRQLRRRLPAAAVAGRPARELHPRARALRQRARLHRLQPESGSVGRPLEGAAADRPLVVSALREDGRARRAGDGPRQHVVQPVLPRDRRALHQRRHDGVHAVPDVGPVQGFPDAQVHHPARRRRGAVPLGPLPRPRAGHEAAAVDGAAAEQRLLRHLRLSPPGHRAPDSRSSLSTTSCSPRRWSARCAASIPRPATITTTRNATSTRWTRLSARGPAARSSRATRAASSGGSARRRRAQSTRGATRR